MSGGRWNYEQCNLGYEMFPGCDISYGLGDDQYHCYAEGVKEARRLNPMQDKQISELVFDVLCLIYSADWCQSGDTGEDTYREDVKYFKRKWLKIVPQDAIKAEIDKSIADAIEELSKHRWIPVTEALPEERINPNTRDFEYALCVTIWGDVRPYKYGTPIGGKEAHFWNGAGYVDAYVTHWMPLPTPPNEET